MTPNTFPYLLIKKDFGCFAVRGTLTGWEVPLLTKHFPEASVLVDQMNATHHGINVIIGSMMMIGHGLLHAAKTNEAFAKASGFALGGRIPEGKTYIVGDKSPELVTQPTATEKAIAEDLTEKGLNSNLISKPYVPADAHPVIITGKDQNVDQFSEDEVRKAVAEAFLVPEHHLGGDTFHWPDMSFDNLSEKFPDEEDTNRGKK